MTTMTIDRAAVEQALEALEAFMEDSPRPYDAIRGQAAITALRAALEQQAEPDACGYASRLAVAIWEKHYKDAVPQWKPLDDLMGVLTQIDNMTSGLTPGQDLHLNNGEGFRFSDWTPLYTAPPQRKPLTEEDIERICMTYHSPRQAARAVERAHGITDPQIEDHLARHGIPMPEGDPK